MTSTADPVVAICYDNGAATPTEIVQANRDFGPPLFLVDRDLPHVAELASVLPMFAPTLDVTGRTDESIAAELGSRGLRAAVTYSDSQLVRCAVINSALGGRGLSPSAAWTIVDKSAQRARLAEVAPVRHAVVVDLASARSALAQVGSPAIVKPLSGTASVDVSMVEHADEIEAVRRRLGTVLVGELLQGDPTVAGPGWGDYVSVETAVIGGRLAHFGVHGKGALAPPFLETGCFLPATLSPEVRSAVLTVVTDAIHALEVTDAVLHTEIKLTSSGPRLIEVNGRLGGNIAAVFALAGELDPVELVIRVALGQADPDLITMAEPDRVAFQLAVQPARAGQVVAVSGWGAVRRLPGVRRVIVRARPGDHLQPRRGTLNTSLGLVFGVADSHEQLRELEAQLNKLVTVTFAD